MVTSTIKELLSKIFGIRLTVYIFLGGKTCCAFDCTPNVDTAIEDKIKNNRQKATLQATRVIHACRKESLFFLQTNLTMS